MFLELLLGNFSVRRSIQDVMRFVDAERSWFQVSFVIYSIERLSKLFELAIEDDEELPPSFLLLLNRWLFAK